MDGRPLIHKLRAIDDRWITIGGSENPHKVLLDDQGNIKGGSIPKELHGASIEEGFKALKNTGKRKSSPRKEGESDEDYKKRAAKERRDRRKALAAELAEIMGTTPPTGSPSNDVEKEIDSLIEDISSKLKKDKDYFRNFKEDFIDRLSKMIPMGGKLKYKVAFLPNTPNQRAIKKEVAYKISQAMEILPSHIIDSLNSSPLLVSIQDKDYRSSADPFKGIVKFNTSPTIHDVSHELMHIAEHRMKVKTIDSKGNMGEASLGEINTNFIKERGKGEKAKWLGPPYGKEEVAIFDSFTNPYMGKIYEEYPGITEVSSMGTALLISALSLDEHLRKDKGYLKHILKTLNPNTVWGVK